MNAGADAEHLGNRRGSRSERRESSCTRRPVPGARATGGSERKGKVFPMSQDRIANSKGKQVAVIVGATSKWQSNGRNTLLAHGRAMDDSDLPVGVRWGVGGAIAQKFAQEGFFVVLTTRNAANAAALEQAIREQGGECVIVEMDLVS
jgi:hypothetical protein